MSTHKYRFQYKKEYYNKLSQICNQGMFSQGLKNEFETAMVNEPSVFEPLKFCCTILHHKYIPILLSVFLYILTPVSSKLLISKGKFSKIRKSIWDISTLKEITSQTD